MRTKSTTTKAAGHEYEISYQEFESLAEVLETVDGGEATALAIINAAQRQNAMQGAKATVVAAVEDEDATEESIAEAVEAHRKSAAGYVIGKPRGGGTGGVTKKVKGTLGDRIVEYTQEHGKPPSQAVMADLMAELGIS